MTGRAAHRRPGLRHRLWVAWDNITTAVFWAVYRGSEVWPWTRVAHQDRERHELRIEQLEHHVRQLTTAMQTCVHCIEGLTELTSDQQ